LSAHLRPAEFVDALEGALPPARGRHLAGCASCRAHAEQLRAALDAAEAGDPPVEPPPAFWTELSQRVHEAVAAEPAPRPAAFGWLQPPARRLALAGAAAAAALVVAVWQGSVPGPRPADTRQPAPVDARATVEEPGDAGSDTVTDEGWIVVLSVADEATPDALDAAGVALRPESVDHLTSTLTDRERLELARLVEDAMKPSRTEPSS
jgi:hypothetical protein